MIAYVYIVLVLKLLGLGILMGRDDGHEAVGAFISLVLLIPIAGRVLGWW